MSRRRSGGVVTAATGALRTGSAIPGSFWKRKILSGRLADPARPGEVNVSFTLAQRFHLRAGGPLQLALSEAQSVNTERSIRPQAVALWLLAGLFGVIGVLIVGQLLARLSFLEATGYGTLRALGMSRGQLITACLGRAAAIGAAGGVIAAVLGVAFSPLLPVGLAGVAEPHPGIDADVPVLAAGLAAAVLVTVGCAIWPGWRAAAERPLPRLAEPRCGRPADHHTPADDLGAAAAARLRGLACARLHLMAGPRHAVLAGSRAGRGGPAGRCPGRDRVREAVLAGLRISARHHPGSSRAACGAAHHGGQLAGRRRGDCRAVGQDGHTEPPARVLHGE